MNDPKFLVPGRYCGGGGPSRGLGAGVRALFVDSPHRALTSRWPFTGRRPLRQVHCPPLHWREARREADDGRSFQGARRLCLVSNSGSLFRTPQNCPRIACVDTQLLGYRGRLLQAFRSLEAPARSRVSRGATLHLVWNRHCGVRRQCTSDTRNAIVLQHMGTGRRWPCLL